MLIVSKLNEIFKKPLEQIQGYLRMPHFWAQNGFFYFGKFFFENIIFMHLLVIFPVQYFLKILRADLRVKG